MRKPLLFLRYFLSFFFLFFFSLYGTQEYVEPQDVATTEGLPSSLVNQSVCVISGEYTDSVLDIVIPGPEPLVISRAYNSFSKAKPWSFNHYDKLILGNAHYDGIPSCIVSFRMPSSAQLDYFFEEKENRHKHKKIPFKLIVPKGLTNGASILSGKTNIKNQTLHFYPDEEMIVAQSGAGNRKTFKKIGKTSEGWPISGQISEEKVNGSQIRYEGKATGLSGAAEIICENKETKQRYSSVEATMLIIPHSRGAVYTRNAMIDSPQALRDRVDIRAFAPGAFIDPHLCKSIMHYESKRDIVPYIDVSGRQRCKDTIIRLQPDAAASRFLDHKFTSPTFVGRLKFVTKNYMRNSGSRWEFNQGCFN